MIQHDKPEKLLSARVRLLLVRVVCPQSPQITQVHKHHPPLVYGRTMKGSPETSEGFAVCQVTPAAGGPAVYGVITYQ